MLSQPPIFLAGSFNMPAAGNNAGITILGAPGAGNTYRIFYIGVSLQYTPAGNCLVTVHSSAGNAPSQCFLQTSLAAPGNGGYFVTIPPPGIVLGSNNGIQFDSFTSAANLVLQVSLIYWLDT